ncbi:MAG: hypothetical protein RR061_07220 [Muribaculaceae bacterium]
MIIQQLSIFLEDKTGSLARVTEILAHHGINMSAFCVADATDYGILRMVVGRPQLALDILRNHNYSVHVTDVVCLKLKDVSGSLNKALKVLSNNGLGIDYMYAYASATGVAIAVMHCQDNQKMSEVLQANKMELMCAEDII